MIDRIWRNAYGVDAKNAKTAKGRKAFALLCAPLRSLRHHPLGQILSILLILSKQERKENTK